MTGKNLMQESRYQNRIQPSGLNRAPDVNSPLTPSASSPLALGSQPISQPAQARFGHDFRRLNLTAQPTLPLQRQADDERQASAAEAHSAPVQREENEEEEALPPLAAPLQAKFTLKAGWSELKTWSQEALDLQAAFDAFETDYNEIDDLIQKGYGSATNVTYVALKAYKATLDGMNVEHDRQKRITLTVAIKARHDTDATPLLTGLRTRKTFVTVTRGLAPALTIANVISLQQSLPAFTAAEMGALGQCFTPPRSLPAVAALGAGVSPAATLAKIVAVAVANPAMTTPNVLAFAALTVPADANAALAALLSQKTWTAADGQALLNLLPNLTVSHIEEVLTALVPLGFAAVIGVITPLRADALTPSDLRGMLNRLKAQGKNGTAIQTLVTQMRGNLVPPDNGGGAAPNARAITSPLDGAGAAGERVLNGGQIHSLIAANPPIKGQAAPQYQNLYPTGQDFTRFTEPELWEHVGSDAKFPNQKGGLETDEQMAARKALALRQLKQVNGDAAWVETLYELFKHTAFGFSLSALRAAVSPLRPALTAAEIKTMLGWLSGITGAQALRLIKALGDGLPVARIFALLQMLHNAPASMTGTAIYDLIVQMRGNLSVHAGGGLIPVEARSILTQLSNGAGGKKDPDSAGERVLTSAEIDSHVTGRLGHLTPADPAPALGIVYPTGQDFTALNANALWMDCHTAARYPDLHTGVMETAPQIEMRRKLALNRLKTGMGFNAALVQAVFNFNNGQTPRPFVSAATEDGYGLHGHTVDSHVLNGGGQIGTRDQLARRVCLKQPQCGARATAFTDIGQANAAIGLLNAYLTANWLAQRQRIATGGQQVITLANGSGLIFEKTDAPRGDPYTPADMNGGRPLHAGSPNPQGRVPLTTTVAATNVRINIDTHASAPGGWHIVTAFPE